MPWRSGAEHATSRSRRLPTALNLYERAGKKHFVSLKFVSQSGARTCDFRAVFIVYVFYVSYYISPFSAGAVFKRQNLTSIDVTQILTFKDGPRTERANIIKTLIMAVDP